MSPKITLPSPARMRKLRKTQVKTCKDLTQKILDESAAKAAAEAAAAAAAVGVTEAKLMAAELKAWHEDLQQRLGKIIAHPKQNLGFIEVEIARASKEPQRLLAQRAAQAKANATAFLCGDCKAPLGREQMLGRTIRSSYGDLRIYRRHGYCNQCEKWHFPADLTLGLQAHCPASPYLQEVVALLGSKMPSEQAAQVAERFGLDLSRCFIHREGLRQGLKAQEVRQKHLEELDTWEGLQKLATQKQEPGTAPFTLVIEIDAWNIRERDFWTLTELMRQKALEDKTEMPSRWHWVYVGTVFRLDHRSQTSGHRAVISQRRYACTRLGVEALMRQLYRQAIDCGLGQAKEVLVIADGAVWIWNATQDRFPQAINRLDLYHAEEHLWEVANDLYGKGTPEARDWVAPLLKQVRNDQHAAMIQSLKEVQSQVGEKLSKKVQSQIDYFKNNENRMKYKAVIQARKAVEKGTATEAQKIKAAEPLGSGAIESTCRQYQCRFKRTGQFWSMVGDEALMCLETFWRNGRWHDLFPHATPPPHANN